MIQYTEYTNPLGGTFILRINEDATESHIPLDPANSDHQAYLKWVEENNG